ncbi:sensor histidine kinase [Pengzhenrongella sicca]|uniref:histidine kinase n=1 Tax=Pengzhenrongella sicca TaxID=2819238 RepID=A0A8A4ZHF2_9MICO|nr:sensor histidine kinase [Pengzhenrongella sicca]QTE29956.1 sensor histidine kinase [Pengzhenrongella sicca]
MSPSPRHFAHRVVGVALIVRLVAITVATFTLVGETMTAPILFSTVALGASGLLGLAYPAVLDFVVRHPLALIVDILVTLAVVATLGVESPFVLATFSTALIVGVLFERRTAVAAAVVLVAGYLLAARVEVLPDRGFMVAVGVPVLYVCLVAIGSVVQTAHEQQASAAREIALARESAASADERARLAREMHDSLGKTLLGIALAADALPMWVERDPAVALVEARGLAGGARQAADEARRLLVRMRVDQPDRPLVEVLASVCQQWQAHHGIPCRFTCAGAVDLSTDARYEILAIIGEALENVARHARASVVDVAVHGGADGAVLLSVQDDGQGFVPQSDGTSPRGHFGLTGMQERAQVAGASVTIRTGVGGGTRVLVQHPARLVRQIADEVA